MAIGDFTSELLGKLFTKGEELLSKGIDDVILPGSTDDMSYLTRISAALGKEDEIRLISSPGYPHELLSELNDTVSSSSLVDMLKSPMSVEGLTTTLHSAYAANHGLSQRAMGELSILLDQQQALTDASLLQLKQDRAATDLFIKNVEASGKTPEEVTALTGQIRTRLEELDQRIKEFPKLKEEFESTGAIRVDALKAQVAQLNIAKVRIQQKIELVNRIGADEALTRNIEILPGDELSVALAPDVRIWSRGKGLGEVPSKFDTIRRPSHGKFAMSRIPQIDQPWSWTDKDFIPRSKAEIMHGGPRLLDERVLKARPYVDVSEKLAGVKIAMDLEPETLTQAVNDLISTFRQHQGVAFFDVQDTLFKAFQRLGHGSPTDETSIYQLFKSSDKSKADPFSDAMQINIQKQLDAMNARRGPRAKEITMERLTQEERKTIQRRAATEALDEVSDNITWWALYTNQYESAMSTLAVQSVDLIGGDSQHAFRQMFDRAGNPLDIIEFRGNLLPDLPASDLRVLSLLRKASMFHPSWTRNIKRSLSRAVQAMGDDLPTKAEHFNVEDIVDSILNDDPVFVHQLKRLTSKDPKTMIDVTDPTVPVRQQLKDKGITRDDLVKIYNTEFADVWTITEIKEKAEQNLEKMLEHMIDPQHPELFDAVRTLEQADVAWNTLANLIADYRMTERAIASIESDMRRAFMQKLNTRWNIALRNAKKTKDAGTIAKVKEAKAKDVKRAKEMYKDYVAREKAQPSVVIDTFKESKYNKQIDVDDDIMTTFDEYLGLKEQLKKQHMEMAIKIADLNLSGSSPEALHSAVRAWYKDNVIGKSGSYVTSRQLFGKEMPLYGLFLANEDGGTGALAWSRKPKAYRNAIYYSIGKHERRGSNPITVSQAMRMAGLNKDETLWESVQGILKENGFEVEHLVPVPLSPEDTKLLIQEYQTKTPLLVTPNKTALTRAHGTDKRWTKEDTNITHAHVMANIDPELGEIWFHSGVDTEIKHIAIIRSGKIKFPVADLGMLFRRLAGTEKRDIKFSPVEQLFEASISELEKQLGVKGFSEDDILHAVTAIKEAENAAVRKRLLEMQLPTADSSGGLSNEAKDYLHMNKNVINIVAKEVSRITKSGFAASLVPEMPMIQKLLSEGTSPQVIAEAMAELVTKKQQELFLMRKDVSEAATKRAAELRRNRQKLDVDAAAKRAEKQLERIKERQKRLKEEAERRAKYTKKVRKDVPLPISEDLEAAARARKERNEVYNESRIKAGLAPRPLSEEPMITPGTPKPSPALTAEVKVDPGYHEKRRIRREWQKRQEITSGVLRGVVGRDKAKIQSIRVPEYVESPEAKRLKLMRERLKQYGREE